MTSASGWWVWLSEDLVLLGSAGEEMRDVVDVSPNMAGAGGRQRTCHGRWSGTVLADSLPRHFVLFLNEELGTR